jgi:hypothetical protein
MPASGSDPGWLVDLFADTSGGPNVLTARGAVVAAALGAKEPSSATFDCDGIRKDLRTMVAEARARLPVAAGRTHVCGIRPCEWRGWGVYRAARLLVGPEELMSEVDEQRV